MVLEKMHRADKTAHVEVIIMYAMIAIARQVIILDVKELPSMTLVGIAAIIVALAAAKYYYSKIK
jgi:uncharacterized membrane protein (DUF373 family)